MMRKIWHNKILWSTIATVVALASIYALWSYILSFQTVTFSFDTKQGYVELVDDTAQRLYPADGQELRLKKGTYYIRNVGDKIAEDAREITVDATLTAYSVEFNFTREYLDELYARESGVIQSTLIKSYPKIPELYDIRHSKLYHQGEVYGAILVAKDQSGDNADTLRVLMRKENNDWVVLSKPPVPILSIPSYPAIDRAVLIDINQAR